MKVQGDFLGPPRSTDKTTLIIKVSKVAILRIGKIRALNEPKYDNFSDLDIDLEVILKTKLFQIKRNCGCRCKDQVNKPNHIKYLKIMLKYVRISLILW